MVVIMMAKRVVNCRSNDEGFFCLFAIAGVRAKQNLAEKGRLDFRRHLESGVPPTRTWAPFPISGW